MKLNTILIVSLFIFLLSFIMCFSLAVGQEKHNDTFPFVRMDTVSLRAEDRIRLAEAFRLAEELRDHIWKNWSKAPLAVLLITPEREFLIRHPQPTEDFTSVGYDSLLQSDVHVRPRQFPPNLLASFPAVAAVPTIVMGQPENTGHTSTSWVLTLLHEHFHQLQYSRNDYYRSVEELNLAGKDQTGMWMLKYPFPYDSVPVQERFDAMAHALEHALKAAHSENFTEKFAVYLEARESFRGVLPEADYRYFAFQEWQEGVARYTEYRVARLAAQRYTPTPAFRALPDYIPFSEAARGLEQGIREGTRAADLSIQRRVAFYAVGAAAALLLDRAAPDWKQRYFTEMFRLDGYFNLSSGNEEMGLHFKDRGINGTFVLYDLHADRYYIHNPERAVERFIPASTFKIVNSLIALETGVIADTSTVLRWDGQHREVGSWNRDHSMKSAFHNSVVWYYQELARRAGENKMREMVSQIGYGNNNIGGGIDQFWLTGDLRINAYEQVDFLVRLYKNDLPFSERIIDMVRNLMIEERTDEYVLHAKTGWARRSPADIGWYVGYVESNGRPYFFALNIDIKDAEQAAERKRITRAILTDLEIFRYP